MTTDQKIRQLQQQLDKNPFLVEKWNKLADLYFKNNQSAETIEAADFSLAIQPENNPVLRTKALQLILTNEPENIQKGETLLEEYCRQFPDDTSIQFILSLTLISVGRLTEAAKLSDRLFQDDITTLETLKQIFRTHDVRPIIYLPIIHNYRNLRQYEKAQVVIEQLLTICPQDPFLYLSYAGILLEQKQKTVAEEWIQKAQMYARKSNQEELCAFELGCEYFNAQLYQYAYDTFRRVDKETLYHRSIPYLACCCLELKMRDDYFVYLEQMKNHSLLEIKYVFSNHIPQNLDRNEIYDFLQKIYDRCNS